MAIQGLEFDKPTLVDGGHEQKAIVNTASGKQPVNAPTVEDIKRIAKGEAEQASATEWEKSIKDKIFYDADNNFFNIETSETTSINIGGITGDFVNLEDDGLWLSGGDSEIVMLSGSSLVPEEGDIYDLGSDVSAFDRIYVNEIGYGQDYLIQTSDLQRGKRIYKHIILLQDEANHFFKFEYYNSSPTPIEDVDIISNDKSFECCSGIYYNNNVQPHTRHVALIEEIDVGDIHIQYGDTNIVFSDITATDTVYQL